MRLASSYYHLSITSCYILLIIFCFVDPSLQKNKKKSLCERKRAAALKKIQKNITDEPKPTFYECTEDGHFKTVQCKGHCCICVLKRTGDPIENTMKCNDEPKPTNADCQKARNLKKECYNKLDRKMKKRVFRHIQKYLIANWDTYLKSPPLASPCHNNKPCLKFDSQHDSEDLTDEQQEQISQFNKAALEWRFIYLDKRNDELLTIEELKPLLTNYSSLNMKPESKCARTFGKSPEYTGSQNILQRFFQKCDRNNDLSISRFEWYYCFGYYFKCKDYQDYVTRRNDRTQQFFYKDNPDKAPKILFESCDNIEKTFVYQGHTTPTKFLYHRKMCYRMPDGWGLGVGEYKDFKCVCRDIYTGIESYLCYYEPPPN